MPVTDRYALAPGLVSESWQDAQTTTLSQITSILRRYWLLILLLAVLGAVGGVASVVVDSPVYRARVLLEVQGINEAWLKNSLDSSTTYESHEVNIQTQIQLLRGGPFLNRVFERLQSETVPLTPVGTDIFSKLRQRVRPDTQDPIQNVRRGLQVALQSFEPRPINRTRLLEMTCESTSPEIASQFLNTMANEFIEETMRARMQNSQKTGEWLSAQIEETKMKLQEAEERMQEFVRASGNLFVSPDITLDDAKLVQLRAELSRIQSDRIAKQTKYELTVKTPLQSLPEVLNDDGLRVQQNKINEMRREKAALETTFTPQHPKVKRIDAQLALLQATLQNELTGVVSRIRNEYETALRQEKMLATAYASQSQQVTAISGKAAQYNALRREVETLRNMYQALILQANQAGLSSSIPVSPIRLVELSTPPRAPYKPSPPLNISFGVIVGLGLAVAIVFIREKSDQSVKSPGLSRSLMNAPELGVIPSAEPNGRALQRLRGRFPGRAISLGLSAEKKKGEVGFWTGGASVLAESFRGTLASLLRDVPTGSSQAILITSAGPGEGKTMVAANLAIALAETGRRVVLVDGDFRRPRLHEVFHVGNERALVDLLAGETQVDHYEAGGFSVATNIPGLTLLPNRASGSNIFRALYSPRLSLIIDHLRHRFDMVIIDGAPILNPADARIVGRLTDGVVLVMRAGVTNRGRVLEAYQRICEDNLKLLGTVLNDWNLSKEDLKYQYYYTHSDVDEKA